MLTTKNMDVSDKQKENSDSVPRSSRVFIPGWSRRAMGSSKELDSFASYYFCYFLPRVSILLYLLLLLSKA